MEEFKELWSKIILSVLGIFFILMLILNMKPIGNDKVDLMTPEGENIEISYRNMDFCFSSKQITLENMKQAIQEGKYYGYSKIYEIGELSSGDKLYAIDSDNRGLVSQYVAILEEQYVLEIKTVDHDISLTDLNDEYVFNFIKDVEPVITILLQYQDLESVEDALERLGQSSKM